MNNTLKTNQFLTVICLLILLSTEVLSRQKNTPIKDSHHHNNHGHASNHSHPATELDINKTQKSMAQQTLSCEQSITAEVNGLVCDFCARALEKVFSKEDAVDHINVNLDQGLIGIHFHENQSITQDELTQLITDSGYNVVNYKTGCANE